MCAQLRDYIEVRLYMFLQVNFFCVHFVQIQNIEKSSWSHHEIFKYLTPSGNLLVLSNDHINEVKNTLVYLIHHILNFI